MVLNQVDPKPVPYEDDSTIHAASTPPESVVANLWEDHDPSDGTRPNSSVPWPGRTFIIRSASSGRVLTLLDGQVVLTQPGGRGSIHWRCVENQGWLGFRNPVSGQFLGYNVRGRLVCSALRQQGWENFCVRIRPEGGYILLMTHWDKLWHVGIVLEEGIEKLAKIGERLSDGHVWEFVTV